ncbi:DNA recombination protein RmuC [Candidatus Gracilibacteria bacterium]|nr:DNA recombination protein RmuC [Candidatus Gracilibacteria bacterium]
MNIEILSFSPLWIMILLLIGIIFFLVSGQKNSKGNMNEQSIGLLQEQILHLRKVLDNRLDENTKNQTKQFEVSQSMSKQAQENIVELTKKLSSIEHTNKEIREIGNQLEGLENILKNPKRRGNLGEYFLKELLENVFQSDNYALQHPIGDKGIVDAALFIGGKVIPIDSKFPYDNYEKLVQAENETDSHIFAKQLTRDIKTRIDETSKYIDLASDTTDFAFLLLPAEGLYYDIFIGKVGNISPQDLTQYAFSKKVIICSPSGFYAYLQTVIQGLKYLKIEEDVRQVVKYVNKLEKDLDKYQEVFGKLGNTLQTAQNHYDAASKRLDIIDTDIYKIHELEGEKK